MGWLGLQDFSSDILDVEFCLFIDGLLVPWLWMRGFPGSPLVCLVPVPLMGLVIL